MDSGALGDMYGGHWVGAGRCQNSNWSGPIC